MDMLKIGNFLADLRKEHNLTQEQLGDELGVTNKLFRVGKRARICRLSKCYRC